MFAPIDQRLTIPRKGLVGWWDFSIQKCYPDSGTTVTNLVGTTGNLTITGSPTWTTGKPQGRKSVDCNTSGKYLKTSTGVTALQPASGLSFSIWIKPDTYNASYNGVAGMTLAGQQRGYLFDTAPSNMNFNLGNGSWATVSVTRGATDVWTHYVGTWDGSNIKIFKNGTDGGGSTAKTGVTYTGCALALSRYYNSVNNTSDMRIAHVAVWDRALSADEITHLYNTTKRQFE